MTSVQEQSRGMEGTTSSNLLRDELTCSICLNIYSDPVLLSCGHNFCRVCIGNVLDKQDTEAASHTCPDCRAEFRDRPALQNNTKVCNIVELFLAEQTKNDSLGIFCVLSDISNKIEERNQSKLAHSHQKCSIHGKILDYFCLEDKIIVCDACCLVGEHRGHGVEPLCKAAKRKKEKLRNDLEQLNSEKEETHSKIKSLKENMKDVQVKATCMAEQVTALIGDLKKQLETLEKRVLNELSRQKEQISIQVSDLIQTLDLRNKELAKEICHIEALCNLDDLLIVPQVQDPEPTNLLNFRFQEKESIWNSDKISGSMKHLDETMLFAPFEKNLHNLIDCLPVLKAKRGLSQHEESDLLLDVDTSLADIIVSSDLKILTGCRRHWQSQEESDQYVICQALSTKSFSSGQHYWEVETSKCGNWRIGVSYSRKKLGRLCDVIGSSGESWCLWKWDMHSSVNHNGKQTYVYLDPFTHRYGIYLDYGAGRLSFYQLCDPIQHLYTFSAKFTEPLHAAFFVYMNAWVRIWS